MTKKRMKKYAKDRLMGTLSDKVPKSLPDCLWTAPENYFLPGYYSIIELRLWKQEVF